ncbi:DUF4395 family protein [Natronorubrum sp. JWXQ-INN-674]|uniref:DUF4395 family protein n=1 Tax=Natronorubrum halalkaliphilum TaxID=2691917 RepID=A0A6B0VRA4_9EURY|nr:DUF4395 domain-containing protein [Natronorubrum halalkaliphilum]MXV64371.1 DUF4395 family protein [Natronorubrum halalkaliphilum]
MSTEQMSHATQTTAESDVTVIDPRAPRFGQSITATLLLVGVVLAEPVLIYTVAVILGLATVSRWRLDLYRLSWEYVVIPVLGRPNEPEPAAPHRFAKLLGATGAVAASLFLIAGISTGGFAIATAVGLLAGLAATTGFCLGCRMYRQVSFLRSRGVL